MARLWTLALWLPIATCGSRPPAPDADSPPLRGEVLEPPGAGFRFTAPSPEWKLLSKTPPDGAVQIFARGPSGCVAHVHAYLRPSGPLENWAKLEAELAAADGGTLAGLDLVPFGERQAYRFEVGRTVPGEKPSREETTVVFAGTRGYTFGASSTAADLPAARRCFDTVRAAFDLVEPPP